MSVTPAPTAVPSCLDFRASISVSKMVALALNAVRGVDIQSSSVSSKPVYLWVYSSVGRRPRVSWLLRFS